MTGVALPWMTEVVIVSWRTVHQEKRPPLPSELLSTFVIFGSFSVIAASQPQIGAALGWGIVIATFLNLFDPANPGHLLSKPVTAQPTTKAGKAS